MLAFLARELLAVTEQSEIQRKPNMYAYIYIHDEDVDIDDMAR